MSCMWVSAHAVEWSAFSTLKTSVTAQPVRTQVWGSLGGLLYLTKRLRAMYPK